jgi:hypothetical protein
MGVDSARVQVWVDTEVVLLEHSNVRRMRSCKVRLRCRSYNSKVGRGRGGGRDGVDIEGTQAILERVQSDKLCKLAVQYLGVASEVVG